MTTAVLTHVKGQQAVRVFVDFGSGMAEVAHLVDATPAGVDRATIDTTDIDTNGYKTFAPGLIDPGDVSMTLHFNPSDPSHATVTGLLSMFANLNFYPWQIRWPDVNQSVWAFSGFLTSAKPDAKLGAAITATCAVKISGQINYDAGPWVT